MSSNTPNAQVPVRRSRESYNAYQRDLMRKRRAAKKKAGASNASNAARDEIPENWRDYAACSRQMARGLALEAIRTLAALEWWPSPRKLTEGYKQFLDSSSIAADADTMLVAIRHADPEDVAKAMFWVAALVRAQLEASIVKRGPLARRLRLGDQAQYLAVQSRDE